MEIPESLRLHIFRAALDRALSNVVRNADRYAGHAGPIQIKAEANEDWVIIRICDQGPGVPEEAIPRLFDPFFRPENARSRHTGGSGLVSPSRSGAWKPAAGRCRRSRGNQTVCASS